VAPGIVIDMDTVRGVDRRALLADALLAVAIGAVVFAGTQGAARWEGSAARSLDVLGYALAVLAPAALAVRRVWPIAALAVSTAATTAYLIAGYAYGPILLAPIVALYTVGSQLSLRLSLPAASVSALALIAHVFVGNNPAGAPATVLMAAPWAGLFMLPWAVGAVMRLWRQSHLRQRSEEAQRAAFEERLKVAREVHDVVGHGLAVINMQAAVALHVLERRPEQAQLALEAIKQSSKDALDELRGTLAVFRDRNQAGEEGRRPTPGLAHLETLVTATAEGGLPVDLVVSGSVEDLPAAVDLAAYRIVQESLTNVVRHAGPTRATVRVTSEPGRIVLEVRDAGRARPGANGRRDGHGIAGMRERAAAVGGTLEAGPRPEGGFRVVATLPYGSAR
jgi:signal transduction histidine kinase